MGVETTEGVAAAPDMALESDADTEPVVGPEHGAVVAGPQVPIPRLVRHQLTLPDGHRVGVAVSGVGMPVVLIHGFSAEGILYAQSLARLTRLGLKVIAVDVAGHGSTQGLPTGGGDIVSYAALVGRVLDALGVERAILAGHSLGGRLVAELAAAEPDRAVAVVLINAAVGATWDRLVRASRLAPPVLAALGGLLVADTLTTLPLLRNPTQAVKLGRLVAPTLVGHALRPWRLVGPGVSLLRSRPSHEAVVAMAEAGVPVVVVHGDRDLAVPHRAAEDTARALGGTLVTVHGGTHSWLLKDPETLPAIVAELLGARRRPDAAVSPARSAADVVPPPRIRPTSPSSSLLASDESDSTIRRRQADDAPLGPLGELRDRVLAEAGLDPNSVTPAEIEDVFLPPTALVRQLDGDGSDDAKRRIHAPRQPRYRWTVRRLVVSDDALHLESSGRGAG